MPIYAELNGLWKDPKRSNSVADYLANIWIADYCQRLGAATADLVEVSEKDFRYLFDVAQSRLIAAWGFSVGRSDAPRDKARMAGSPGGPDPKYHRGHAIPHRMGGGTDINLVPQWGALNIGPFRVLENKAIATPGALYFTYWIYLGALTQTPAGVEQGLLCPGEDPEIKSFRN